MNNISITVNIGEKRGSEESLPPKKRFNREETLEARINELQTSLSEIQTVAIRNGVKLINTSSENEQLRRENEALKRKVDAQAQTILSLQAEQAHSVLTQSSLADVDQTVAIAHIELNQCTTESILSMLMTLSALLPKCPDEHACKNLKNFVD